MHQTDKNGHVSLNEHELNEYILENFSRKFELDRAEFEGFHRRSEDSLYHIDVK